MTSFDEVRYVEELAVTRTSYIVILAQYDFAGLVQRIFNCDKIQYTSPNPDTVLRILILRIAFLCHRIHELPTVKNSPLFYWTNLYSSAKY